jgi:hypothetical protein
MQDDCFIQLRRIANPPQVANLPHANEIYSCGRKTSER